MTPAVSGSINRVRQPTIPVAVLDPERRQFITFNFIVDTGFDGDLQLPKADISRLGLTSTGTVNTQLADGQVVRARTYPATVVWLGTSTAVNVIESEKNIPLMGAKLLWGSSMTVQWEFGGLVIIAPLSEPE